MSALERNTHSDEMFLDVVDKIEVVGVGCFYRNKEVLRGCNGYGD